MTIEEYFSKKHLIVNQRFSSQTISNKEYHKLKADYVIFKDIHFDSQHINESRFMNCCFIGCIFSNCFIENVKFIDCVFNKVKWDRVLFQDNHYSNCRIYHSKMKNCEDIYSEWEGLFIIGLELNGYDLKPDHIRNVLFEQSSFIKTKIKNVKEIDQVNLNINVMNQVLFYQVNFQSIDLSCEQWNNVSLINCSGVSKELKHQAIESGGRQKSYVQLVLKNPFIMIPVLVVGLFLSFQFYQFFFSENYLFSRYILRDSWNNRSKSDLSNELNILKKIRHSNPETRSKINQAIKILKDGKERDAFQLYFKIYKSVAKKEKDLDLLMWIIHEMILVCPDEKNWEVFVNSVELYSPQSMIQSLRKKIIDLMKWKYYPNVTLKVLERYLLDTGDDTQLLSEMVHFISGVASWKVEFKNTAAYMIRSFLKRKIRDYPHSEDEYEKMIVIVEDWIEYYASF